MVESEDFLRTLDQIEEHGLINESPTSADEDHDDENMVGDDDEEMEDGMLDEEGENELDEDKDNEQFSG